MPSEAAARPQAVIFDVDGTLVDTERDQHRPAFNAAFEALGLPYRWDVDEYGRLLETAGGQRRIAGYLREQGHPGDTDGLAAELHATKTRLLREQLLAWPVIPRPGVRELIDALDAAGARVAVCTTGRSAWVHPLLEKALGPREFAALVVGDDVPDDALKPNPLAYNIALERLGLDAGDAVVVEDSRNGLLAALAAGLTCWVVRNDYTAAQDFTGAAGVFDGYGAPDGLTVEHVLNAIS